jgi:hypothetical protein
MVGFTQVANQSPEPTRLSRAFVKVESPLVRFGS